MTIEIGDEPPFILMTQLPQSWRGPKRLSLTNAEVTIESNIDSVNEIRIDDNDVRDLTQIETNEPDVAIEAEKPTHWTIGQETDRLDILSHITLDVKCGGVVFQ